VTPSVTLDACRPLWREAVEVSGLEPLPAGHPLRTLPNVLATPHIGYVTEDLYRTFYSDAAASIAVWLEA
jgi:phosphoglycerate dehydrogenase-like enzyme